MNSAQLQPRIAELRAILSRIMKSLDSGAPESPASSEAAAAAGTKRETPAALLDSIIPDLKTLGERIENRRKLAVELAEANRRLIEEIREREKMHGAQAAEKVLLAITLRNLSEAVITIDAENRITLFNAAAETLTGWSSADAVGKQIHDVLEIFEEKNHTRQCADFVCRCIVASERRMENRYLLRSRNGTEHFIACECACIREGSERQGSVVVLRDITQSYFAEEEHLKMRKLESVGVLAAGIAHDFNNLLSGITTYLLMARMSAEGNTEACSLIEDAEKVAVKAGNLAKQLLSFSKGSLSVKETASIKQLVQDTVGFCLSGTNVDYRLDLSDDLAPVDVDKGQIDQVFTNLLNNAAQAMPDGGTVTIAGENFLLTPEAGQTAGQAASGLLPLPPGRYVKISIMDEGTGIPFNQMERLFDPYFTTKKNGTGLGLTMAYSIIRKHDGHIGAESIPGRGSVFTIFLPASAKGLRHPKTEPFLLKKKTCRILIADDDLVVCTVAVTLLKKAGFKALSVANGEQAVEAYAEALRQGEPFTISIIDLIIPGGMDGKETVKKLRLIDPDAKVIAFSGYFDDPVFTNFSEYGFDGALVKPFSIEDFLRIIAEVLHPPLNPDETASHEAQEERGNDER